MSRLIDADDLKHDHHMGDECDKCETKWRECQYDYIYSKMDFCTWIDDAPTIDAVEVEHGEWNQIEIIDDDSETGVNDDATQCSVCGYVFDSHYWAKTYFNYCPNCGAKMGGERRDDGQIQQSN